MLLLIFAAIFLLFLTIALFFSLHFDYKLKKRGKVSAININQSQIHKTKSNCECDCTDVKKLQKGHLASCNSNISFEIQKDCAQKLCKYPKNICVLKIIGIVFVLFVTGGIYYVTGGPEVKSYLFRELMDKDSKILSKHERIVRLQTLFFRDPHDGKIADELAISYLEENLFQDAMNIYLDSLRLNGESAPRLVGYGLALVGYEGGVITQEAQDVFQKAADLAPNDFYPRLFLADALRQAGKSAQAIQFLENFLDKMPKDIAGRSRVEAMIAQLRRASD
ncbi:tetratricopeptide repeat protein [Bartonella bacilliformis]|uniref:tetratricopeptide repeat protein n=1 Tax=Bartonella bacilliformis TaxID=774 RepID=UPI0039E4DD3E